MRIKVSDGDLIVVSVSGKVITQDYLAKLQQLFGVWLNERGLHNVRVLTSYVEGSTGSININVLSVNDIFESEVLSKE